jgi:chromosome segregation ATPase
MTQTAALTQEERAEIRALAEQCAWAGEKLDVGDVRSAIAATNLDAAAATIPRLLDALEAAERELQTVDAEYAELEDALWHLDAGFMQRTERLRAVERERDALREALNEAIRRPMGVVPDSATPFYRPDAT